jgi:hypothetical protein
MAAMPLTRVPPGRLRYLAVPALVVYLVALLPFLVVGNSGDMIRLQLAGSESKAREIVGAWSHAERVDMAFLQGVDELHPLVYGLLLAVAAVWAGRRLGGSRAARWAPVVAWAAITAAAFDLLENVGMIVMIRGDVVAPWPTITTVFAVAKFSLFVVAVPYALAGVVARLRGKGG